MKGGDFINRELYQQLELPFPGLNSKDPVEFLPYNPLRLTVNEIVRRYFESHPGDFKTYEILHKLMECGTGALGYHLDICDNCGDIKVVANPCNHSVCSRCQERRSKIWIENRIPELLPISYYHINFCLNSGLFVFAMFNKKIVFDFMFEGVASAMFEVSDREKIETGFTGSMHTSAANYIFDPHVHVCMPGIGITTEGEVVQYETVKDLRMSETQLSKKFRDEFLYNFQKLYSEQATKIKAEKDEEIIKWPEELKDLEHDEEKFNKWIEELRQDKWDVQIADEARKGDSAKILYEYIGQRLAIRDEQIIEADYETIKFMDKRGKPITMSIEEFVRRLTLHTMPPCYHRIRNYGFLTNSKKNVKLKYIREQLGVEEAEKKKDESSICKICGEGEIQTVAIILGGGKVKTFEENINKLKILPTWLRALQEIDILRDAPLDVISKLPDWLIRLIESVDDE